MPRTSSTSRDQAILVNQATDASLSSDEALLKIDRFGQRFQRRRAARQPPEPFRSRHTAASRQPEAGYVAGGIAFSDAGPGRTHAEPSYRGQLAQKALPVGGQDLGDLRGRRMSVSSNPHSAACQRSRQAQAGVGANVPPAVNANGGLANLRYMEGMQWAQARPPAGSIRRAGAQTPEERDLARLACSACAGGSTICVHPPWTASAGHDSTMVENPPSGWHVRLTSSGSRFGGDIDCTR